MDDQIKPRALVPAEHKPRMRPLRPGSELAPGGQRWLCYQPTPFRCGTGYTQREALEAAHGVPVYLREGWERDARPGHLLSEAPVGWPAAALARMLERSAGGPW